MRWPVHRAASRRASAFRITWAKIVGWLMAGALPLGCTSAGGVQRDYVQVRVIDAQGNITGPMCTGLPVLWGARVEDELAVADAFAVRVLATPRSVELTITGEGLSTEQFHDIDLAELRGDAVEDIPITTSEDAYIVMIQPGCSG
jgi:hypothetical protein